MESANRHDKPKALYSKRDRVNEEITKWIKRSKYYANYRSRDKQTKRLRLQFIARVEIEVQKRNLDVFFCQLYWCVACRKFKPKYRMKFLYKYPKIKTLEYAKGSHAIPCLCYKCCKEAYFMRPWVKRWWARDDSWVEIRKIRYKKSYMGMESDKGLTTERFLKERAKHEHLCDPREEPVPQVVWEKSKGTWRKTFIPVGGRSCY